MKTEPLFHLGFKEDSRPEPYKPVPSVIKSPDQPLADYPEFPATTPHILERWMYRTPLFWAKKVHLVYEFSFDLAQCNPKYSVQAFFHPPSFSEEERACWKFLHDAIALKCPKGGKTPFHDDVDGWVKVNITCFRQPEQLHDVPLSESVMEKSWMRAYIDANTYPKRSGRPPGVLLGMRAYQVVRLAEGS